MHVIAGRNIMLGLQANRREGRRGAQLWAHSMTGQLQNRTELNAGTYFRAVQMWYGLGEYVAQRNHLAARVAVLRASTSGKWWHTLKQIHNLQPDLCLNPSAQ